MHSAERKSLSLSCAVLTARQLCDISLFLVMARSTPSLADLLPIWQDSSKCIRWCQEKRLLPEQMSCTRCGSRTNLVATSSKDNHVWRCRRKGCQKRVSIRDDTIFEASKLPLPKILQLLYWWAKDLPLTKAAEEVDVTAGTASEWFGVFR